LARRILARNGRDDLLLFLAVARRTFTRKPYVVHSLKSAGALTPRVTVCFNMGRDRLA
jgi:hypothetical protein